MVEYDNLFTYVYFVVCLMQPQQWGTCSEERATLLFLLLIMGLAKMMSALNLGPCNRRNLYLPHQLIKRNGNSMNRYAL